MGLRYAQVITSCARRGVGVHTQYSNSYIDLNHSAAAVNGTAVQTGKKQKRRPSLWQTTLGNNHLTQNHTFSPRSEQAR